MNLYVIFFDKLFSGTVPPGDEQGDPKKAEEMRSQKDQKETKKL
ncbi:hypothetical protein [Candidatus Methanocrinis natronophilus]|uniref:Uncharacterized protein n=1 Tax=Candidatus Methanocrinis natronophilus TaxID=3033396 RepID=A0ABT5X603_9EURY|nr:hypothetical protein [Candidatus Methanocrinis natronophilus]MDF0590131.1 hypothetical protein [Candidatus Methanocrinis natronophilus]